MPSEIDLYLQVFNDALAKDVDPVVQKRRRELMQDLSSSWKLDDAEGQSPQGSPARIAMGELIRIVLRERIDDR